MLLLLLLLLVCAAWCTGTLIGTLTGTEVIGGGPVGREEGDDFCFGEVEAQGFEGDFEFVVVDSLVFV